MTDTAMKDIKKVAVIGAGIMGRGIAAQAANAGYEVVLLDKFEGVAEKAVETMKKAKLPKDAFIAGFMDPKNADRITTGTTDDHMDLIGDCDLVIEAVFERLDIKKATYKLINDHARPDALISSNTSTIQIAQLIEDMPEDFQARFMNTHFFNPPRFTRLLEMIDGEKTDMGNFAAVRDFSDRDLGKKVIRCKDTPGFIANRIGVYAMERAREEAVRTGMAIEDVDSIMGAPFGFPNTGMFKLADMVGLNVLEDVGKNLHNNLPGNDEFQGIYDPTLISRMVEEGYIGNKDDSKGGFYRIKTDESGKVVKDDKGKPVKEVYDFTSGDYRDAGKSSYFRMNVKKKFGSYENFFESKDKAAAFAWPVLRDTMLYTLNHAEEIAYDIQSVDEAMQAGFNWKKGPFALLDDFGLKYFRDKLIQENRPVPPLLNVALEQGSGRFYRKDNDTLKVIDFDGNYNDIKREDGVINFGDLKRGQRPLIEHASARLWDIGDGVVCFEFNDKIKNSLDPSVLHVLNQSLKLVEKAPEKYKAMVIYNDGSNFSPGANLKLIDLFNKAADNKLTRALGLSKTFKNKVNSFVEDMVYSGQAIFKAMREAPFPVIGAPKGQPGNKAFGGGCEILLHCDTVQAGPEQVMGLVEAGVGLIPAWGGSTRTLERAQSAITTQGPMQAPMKAVMALADPLNATSTSSQDARRKGWLRKLDGISMNPDRVLADAKARALAMAEGYEPPQTPTFNLPGKSGKAAIRMNVDSLYLRGDDPARGVNHVDVAVVDALADTVTGGETITPDDIDAGHVTGDENHFYQQLDSREEEAIGVHPQLELTESRLLQLERDNFMTRFQDVATQKRIAHTMKTNQPLRETAPDPVPAPRDIRDNIQPVKTENRTPDGSPLTGNEARRLRFMADTVRETYNLQGSPWKKAKALASLITRVPRL